MEEVRNKIKIVKDDMRNEGIKLMRDDVQEEEIKNLFVTFDKKVKDIKDESELDFVDGFGSNLSEKIREVFKFLDTKIKEKDMQNNNYLRLVYNVMKNIKISLEIIDFVYELFGKNKK